MGDYCLMCQNARCTTKTEGCKNAECQKCVVEQCSLYCQQDQTIDPWKQGNSTKAKENEEALYCGNAHVDREVKLTFNGPSPTPSKPDVKATTAEPTDGSTTAEPTDGSATAEPTTEEQPGGGGESALSNSASYLVQMECWVLHMS